jgi:hypothetical protein
MQRWLFHCFFLLSFFFLCYLFFGSVCVTFLKFKKWRRFFCFLFFFSCL